MLPDYQPDPLAYLHEAGLAFVPRAGLDLDAGVRLQMQAWSKSIPVVDAIANQFTGGMLQYAPPEMNNALVIDIATADSPLVMPAFFNQGMVSATLLQTSQIRGDLWTD